MRYPPPFEPPRFLESGSRPPVRARWQGEDLPFRVLPIEEPEEQHSRGIEDYWRLAMRYKGTLLLVSMLGMLAAVLITIPQTPVYRASLSLEVQNVNENFLNMRDLSPTALSSGSYTPDYDVQTQMRVLQSHALLKRVITNHEDLAKRLAVSNRSGRTYLWKKTLGLVHETPVTTPDSLALQLASALNVHPQPNTRIISLTVDSMDPKLAADFANATADEFIEMSLDERWKSTQRTGEWLTNQMRDLKIKLEKSEEDLQAYARSNQLVFTSEKDNVAEDRLRQLQEELSKALADRVAKQSKYEQASNGQPETLPDVLDDATLKDYQIELSTLNRQLAELSASYTPAHPKVAKVQAQIVTVQRSFDKRRSYIVSRVRNEYESARRREQLLATDYQTQVRLMSAQADKVAHYNILKREADTTRQLYDAMSQRVKEAGIASALRASNIHVIDPAEPPGHPYKPVMAVNAALGLVSGLFLAVVLAFARDRADRRIQAPGDSGMYLNVSELGVIPSDEREGRRRRSILRPGRSEDAGSAERIELATLERRHSSIAEAFRVTLTSILFSAQHGTHPRVLAMSSANMNEGKTTVISNLAIALAQAGQRVLLIDGDMRLPRLHQIFEIDNRDGLSEVLAGKAPLTVRETRVPNLFLVPAGSSADGNLLFKPALGELLKRVRGEFDMVLIDTPPMLQMPDARVLGRHADAMVLVIRAARTSRDAARLACARLAEDGIPLLGTVLTDWNAKTAAGYGYNDYQSQYYYRPNGGRNAL
jgi:capsular exopolysaccharide synthesis family protein